MDDVTKRSGLGGKLNPSYRHGHTTGGVFSKEYSAWLNMRLRCSNPTVQNYAFYGGRGITVCGRWDASFEAFLADAGPCPGAGYSLDRINNAGNYEPGNVRWLTQKEQCRNTRRNHFVEHNGERLTCAEWEERTGLPQIAIIKRLRRGWTPEEALTVPLGKRLFWRGKKLAS